MLPVCWPCRKCTNTLLTLRRPLQRDLTEGLCSWNSCTKCILLQMMCCQVVDSFQHRGAHVLQIVAHALGKPCSTSMQGRKSSSERMWELPMATEWTFVAKLYAVHCCTFLDCDHLWSACSSSSWPLLNFAQSCAISNIPAILEFPVIAAYGAALLGQLKTK